MYRKMKWWTKCAIAIWPCLYGEAFHSSCFWNSSAGIKPRTSRFHPLIANQWTTTTVLNHGPSELLCNCCIVLLRLLNHFSLLARLCVDRKAPNQGGLDTIVALKIRRYQTVKRWSERSQSWAEKTMILQFVCVVSCDAALPNQIDVGLSLQVSC